MVKRLQEIFGVSDQEIEQCHAQAKKSNWGTEALGSAIFSCLSQRDLSTCEDPVMTYLMAADIPRRACDGGGAAQAAMPVRLRRPDAPGCPPALAHRCELCEAQGPDDMWKDMHIDLTHGGPQRYRNAVSVLRHFAGAYVPSGTDKRTSTENARRCQEFGMGRPETLLPSKAYAQWDALAENLHSGFEHMRGLLCDAIGVHAPTPMPGILQEKPVRKYEIQQSREWARRPRQFVACVFCALLSWSEELHRCHLAGPHCFMQSPHLVAELLKTEHYSEAWPLIPRAELDASSVLLPHLDAAGEETSTLVLMHKRRVPNSALTGETTVCVCTPCRDALCGKRPTMPKKALANFLWLGRHLPLLREARLGHALLLALGRVVSTKVYLSSKGRDESARQHAMTWRQKFLQQGMQGTAVVFGNGDAGKALAEFPPSADVLQDSFVAVFTGPEKPTAAQERIMQGASAADQKAQKDMAVQALRKEVELWVEKEELNQQARHLMETNYVYHDSATYRHDLVQDMPAGRQLPAVFEAAATFVKVDDGLDDSTRAHGPATSTSTAQQEADADEAGQGGQWMSVVDESTEDTLEMSKLPALQAMLERMEGQAGRVVANELNARAEEGEYGAEDDVGRQRLQKLCQEFHQHCTTVSREEELLNLQWRIQAMAENVGESGPRNCTQHQQTQETNAERDEKRSTKRPSQLRVPTTTVAQSWWNPRYWSTARPTDFCYGDCVWGLEQQPVPLSIGEWAQLLWRREEMEYDVPGDTEPFVARPINRFRESWYVLHLVTSFWVRSETTKSIHTFLKTPGAFGYTRSVADITPDMLAEVLVKSEKSGKKPSVQSLLSDKDVPAQLRKALLSLHQSTGNVIGSNGHRRLLQKEGVAYTLAYGAPLVFTTGRDFFTEAAGHHQDPQRFRHKPAPQMCSVSANPTLSLPSFL